MRKKNKKKSKNNNELQKQEKLKKKELKKNKIDKVNFAVIISLMILLPLWQLVRMQFAGIDRIDLYQKCHCGYILWVAGSILLVTYIINLVKKRTKIDKIDIIMYAFSLVILISTLLADDKNLAFFGIVDRYEGIFSLLSYNILILTVKNLPLKNRYITIINTFMALGLVQSLIAIIQCFVRSDYILRFSYPFMANALCGNPNYLGSYMMILTILSMAMYLFSEKYNRMYFAFTLIFIFTSFI